MNNNSQFYKTADLKISKFFTASVTLGDSKIDKIISHFKCSNSCYENNESSIIINIQELIALDNDKQIPENDGLVMLLAKDISPQNTLEFAALLRTLSFLEIN
ncbi:hypothetical protein [Photobacterium kishitanii]|uniref:Uncharacterized protein n=1 Tax=Photobacterium kishitanii TaxID=318456 RepID=A0A2T3KKV2_9GAMM|nr:hypothetical protein [Photobacterium kishitanii]PSV00348.1 hypothetical protein C9J27_04270 [Photobacterium kishitanii]